MKYSAAEYRLFSHFNRVDLMEREPINAYQELMMHAFMRGEQGPAAEAIRTAMNCIRNCNPFRLTEDFDELICFDETVTSVKDQLLEACEQALHWLEEERRKPGTTPNSILNVLETAILRARTET